MAQKICEIGICDGALIKIEKGKPHEDGVYELVLNLVKLFDDGPEDNILFEKSFLFKIIIDPNITGYQCRLKIMEEYNLKNPENPITME